MKRIMTICVFALAVSVAGSAFAQVAKKRVKSAYESLSYSLMSLRESSADLEKKNRRLESQIQSTLRRIQDAEKEIDYFDSVLNAEKRQQELIQAALSSDMPNLEHSRIRLDRLLSQLDGEHLRLQRDLDIKMQQEDTLKREVQALQSSINALRSQQFSEINKQPNFDTSTDMALWRHLEETERRLIIAENNYNNLKDANNKPYRVYMELKEAQLQLNRKIDLIIGEVKTKEQVIRKIKQGIADLQNSDESKVSYIENEIQGMEDQKREYEDVLDLAKQKLSRFPQSIDQMRQEEFMLKRNLTLIRQENDVLKKEYTTLRDTLRELSSARR